ncbi:hypothetical protein QUF63_04925 [Anaerolineales bacterium HSG25]|nr:hypothetical protein [Anaerolineales bacterium HSG25]
MIDLWPNDITVDQVSVRAPVNILREQASVLAQKTQNLVKADVQPYEREFWELGKDVVGIKEPLDMPSQPFKYSFELVAPVLNNYSYLLFAIFHNVDMYPTQVKLAKSLHVDKETRELSANTEEEFLTILGDIFKAPKTKTIIQSLIAQSTSLPNQ